MKRSLKWAAVGVATVGVVAAAFVGRRAWAGGIPAAAALTYSGLLQDATGAPLSGTQYVEVKFWNDVAASATTNLLCDTGSPGVTPLTNGRFSIPLPDACTTKVGTNTGIWVEVIVGPTATAAASLGRAKIGAVPFAVEANHAVSADSATTAAGALLTTISSLAAASSLPKVTAWADFAAASVPTLVTTNGTVTNVTTTARWRRVGDSVQMRFASVLNGVPTPAGQMFWTLPSGFLANVTNVDRSNIGVAYVWSGGVSLGQVCHAVITGGQNQLYAYCTGAGGPLTTTSPVSPPVEVDFDITYPVQGWTVTQ